MRRKRSGAAGKAGLGAATCLVATLLLPIRGAAAQVASATTTAAAPAAFPPGSELSISVMTMGVGAQVWERFGHNAIVVEDRRRGSSVAYNYGMFSFRQENFLLRFLQGRMMYWMAGYPTRDEILRYIALRRSVWQQELNLAPAQRLALRDYLETNALPENRLYRYDYYRDNCSTRVRDAIDYALSGAFHAQMSAPASGSYRFHTQRLNTHDLLLYTGLLIVLGQEVDAPITRWEEMFLPLKLREYLRDVRVSDSTGALVPLVRSERSLFESDAFPVPETPPRWGWQYLLAGLLLGGLFTCGGVWEGRSRVARWGIAAGATAWALVTGIAGVILAGLWAFTDHLAASRNENVLQASLFAVALAVALPLGLQGRPMALKLSRYLALAVGGLSLVGLLLKALPAFDQVNGQVLALCVPANVGLMLGVLSLTGGTD